MDVNCHVLNKKIENIKDPEWWATAAGSKKYIIQSLVDGSHLAIAVLIICRFGSDQVVDHYAFLVLP